MILIRIINEDNKKARIKNQNERSNNYCVCMAFNIINIIPGIPENQVVSTLK